mmetsp:Transcript_10979/g.23083  ORF Transcript_10979/g.23083 Transcript_10979/m.23083 type:complete len:159 (-) Transcript_10979:60-536(-)
MAADRRDKWLDLEPDGYVPLGGGRPLSLLRTTEESCCDEKEEFVSWEDDRQEPTRCQQIAVGIGCTLLTLYFLPMLSFIPLALAGGVEMPSPWAPGYNNATGVQYVPHREMPTGHWYLSLPTATCVLLFLPVGLVAGAYFLKVRVLPSARSRYWDIEA